MSIEKKLINFYTLYYLLGMNRDFSVNPQNAAKIKKDQNKRVHDIMKTAYGIPFYRSKFDESGTTPNDYHCSEDLIKFPTIKKSDLRVWMQHEYDKNPEKHEDLEILHTSGSTGQPLKIILTQKELAQRNANWIRELAASGYSPLRGKLYSFREDETKGMGNDSFIQRLGIMRRKLIPEDKCVGENIAEVVREVNEYKPNMLVLRRNSLVWLVMYAKEHDIELWKPDYYIPVSEMVDKSTRKFLEDALGPGLIDAFGCTETGNCIVKYPGNDYYNVMNDMVVANVHDDNDRLADTGRLVLTTLFKKDYPIINYDVGDSVDSYVIDGIRYFTEIRGRLNDRIKLENGKWLSAVFLRKIADHAGGIAQFRFTQQTYHDMLIQLVFDKSNGERTREDIEEYFKKEMHERYGDEFNIKIEWVSVLPPDKTRKQRHFVCNVK